MKYVEVRACGGPGDLASISIPESGLEQELPKKRIYLYVPIAGNWKYTS